MVHMVYIRPSVFQIPYCGIRIGSRLSLGPRQPSMRHAHRRCRRARTRTRVQPSTNKILLSDTTTGTAAKTQVPEMRRKPRDPLSAAPCIQRDPTSSRLPLSTNLALAFRSAPTWPPLSTNLALAFRSAPTWPPLSTNLALAFRSAPTWPSRPPPSGTTNG